MISNAAYLSSWTDTRAELPVNEDAFENALAKLCAVEKAEKKNVLINETAEKLSERWAVRW